MIPRRNDGPYAKRTWLGWCVSAEDGGSQTGRVKCNTIRVLETRVKNVSIDRALQKMWEDNFVERDSEKKALSFVLKGDEGICAV